MVFLVPNSKGLTAVASVPGLKLIG